MCSLVATWVIAILASTDRLVPGIFGFRYVGGIACISTAECPEYQVVRLTYTISWKILGMLKFWCRNSSLDNRARQQSLKNFNATFHPSQASTGIQYVLFEWLLACSIVQGRIYTFDIHYTEVCVCVLCTSAGVHLCPFAIGSLCMLHETTHHFRKSSVQENTGQVCSLSHNRQHSQCPSCS